MFLKVSLSSEEVWQRVSVKLLPSLNSISLEYIHYCEHNITAQLRQCLQCTDYKM